MMRDGHHLNMIAGDTVNEVVGEAVDAAAAYPEGPLRSRFRKRQNRPDGNLGLVEEPLAKARHLALVIPRSTKEFFPRRGMPPNVHRQTRLRNRARASARTTSESKVLTLP